MNDIVKALVDQLGLDEAIAQQAVQVVLGVLKDKFPAPLADQLENIINGDDDGGVMDQLGGLLGGDADGDGKPDGGLLGSLGGLLGKK